MGMIVPFETKRRASRSMREIPQGGAEILLFLGVRYERFVDMPDLTPQPEAPESARGGRTKRSRKRA